MFSDRVLFVVRFPRPSGWCSTCRDRRPLVPVGASRVCTSCGERYDSAGKRLPRPFKPGWREASAWEAVRSHAQ